jgi:4-hydroxy-3-polyprenylbenzoate decarboxylase
MGYRSTRECVLDLERHGQLVRIPTEVDARLEMAEIQRRVYAAQGPAILFERVGGSPFPAVSNLFGTVERARWIFRDTLARTRAAIDLRADPTLAWRRPLQHWWAPLAALRSIPRRTGSAPVLRRTTTIAALPQIVSWPDDGGPFVTLPQVYTEDPDRPGPARSNLGMYRIQLSGNAYAPDEVGLHYQIHRGIGVHHTAALARGEPLRVSVWIGGPPAHTFAAVMPLPEGVSEVAIAGILGGRRVRLAAHDGWTVAADADFCILGTVDPGRTRPEGPFGDHLGYYSLQHDFPVLRVEAVHHREGAIWPFTVVGRPPQEDTTFGALIHELTAPMVPVSIPGLRAMHAVDAAGVHPLMLALGSERYVPWRPDAPQELLTIACAILGFSQASLAKVLLIASAADDERLSVHDVDGFLAHVLARVDFSRDLHFHTNTTIDTLDYSGTGLNAGSKLVIAARGPARRELATTCPALVLPRDCVRPILVRPGIVAVQGPPFSDATTGPADAERLCESLAASPLGGIALVVLVDDAAFAAESLRNFLWVTFTRCNPSHDVHGVGAFVEHKHWGCRGPLVIDARRKPHHAPPLVEDPAITRRVDALGAPGRPLHGII